MNRDELAERIADALIENDEWISAPEGFCITGKRMGEIALDAIWSDIDALIKQRDALIAVGDELAKNVRRLSQHPRDEEEHQALQTWQKQKAKGQQPVIANVEKLSLPKNEGDVTIRPKFVHRSHIPEAGQ